MFHDLIDRFRTKLLKRRLTLFITIIVIIALLLLFSNHGILKRIDLEIERSHISERLGKQHRLRDSLLHEIRLLEKDSLEIERIAREKYGMIKPGESVIFIKKEKK